MSASPMLGPLAARSLTRWHEMVRKLDLGDLREMNLQILMQHRGVLFGVVGGLLLAAAFHPPLRAAGYVVGFASMLSFLLIAWLVGGYGAEIQRVILVDLVAIAALAGAGLVQAVFLDAGS